MLEWHFTIRGADDTDFAGGWYHGRILLPPDYPFNPPNIVFLTPSGRFAVNTKVCLSFTAFHKELWQPAWGIRLILEALIAFLPTPADGAIGALSYTSAERKRLAARSIDFCCPCCGKVSSIVQKIQNMAAAAKKNKEDGTTRERSRFQKEIEKLQLLQQQQHASDDHVASETEPGGPSEAHSGSDQAAAEEAPVPANERRSDETVQQDDNDISLAQAQRTTQETEAAEVPPTTPAKEVLEEAPARRRVAEEPRGRIRAPAREEQPPPVVEEAPFWTSDSILNSIIFVLVSYLLFLLMRFSEVADAFLEMDLVDRPRPAN